MREKIEGINKLVEKREFTKALKEINSLISQDSNTELLMIRANIYKHIDEFGNALNDYRKVQKENPDNNFVKAEIEMISNILKYKNLDIYESTNLNHDPWLD